MREWNAIVLYALTASGVALGWPATNRFTDLPLPEGAILRFGDPGALLQGVHKADISPDGLLIATDNAANCIRIWEASSGKLLRSHLVSGRVFDMRWREDGGLAVVSSLTDQTFLMQEFENTKVDAMGSAMIAHERKIAEQTKGQESFDHPYPLLSVDGRRVVAIRHIGIGYGTRRADIYRFSANQSSAKLVPERQLPLPINPRDCWISGNGSTLLTSIESDKEQPHRLLAFDLDGKGNDPAWTLSFGTDPNYRPDACVSADGRHVVIAFWDSKVELWDGPTGKKVRDYPSSFADYFGPLRDTRGVDLSADGKLLSLIYRYPTGAVGGRVIELSTGKDVCTLAPGPLPRMAQRARFSSNGKKLVQVGDGGLRLWDASTGNTSAPSPTHHGRIERLALSWDGKTIVTAGEDLTVRGWDPSTGKELWKRSFPRDVQIRCVTPDGVIVHGIVHDYVSATTLIDTSSGKATPLPGELGETMSEAAAKKEKRYQRDVVLQTAPDGKSLVSLNEHREEFRVWDWPTGNLQTAIPFAKNSYYRLCLDAKFTPEGRYFVAGMVHGNLSAGISVERWNLNAGKLVDRSAPKLLHIALVHHDAGLLTIGKDHIIRDTISGSAIVRLETPFSYRLYASPLPGGTALSPDGRTLAIAETSSPGAVRLFEMASGRVRRDLLFGVRGPDQVAYLPDGRLVTAGDTILTWDLRLKAAPDEIGELSDWWSALKHLEPAKARRSMEALVGRPNSTVDALRERVRPVPTIAPLVDRLVKELDAASFKDREAASAALSRLGRVAVPEVRSKLDKLKSEEARTRAERFLAENDVLDVQPGELQSLRAVEVLETIATPRAIALLLEIAKGEPNARLTRDAIAAIRRLNRQNSE